MDQLHEQKNQRGKSLLTKILLYLTYLILARPKKIDSNDHIPDSPPTFIPI